eukprot:TRINITY_DN4883_c0_g3_i1.p1 TRINITY_DN4883_c0_g3~~TRINITY_DN4883_c0_g3_i1.p1  ORF type:complete len:591 (+),score=106.67 TRINITY_DN4883_c0_g3_i1:93-1865(+)
MNPNSPMFKRKFETANHNKAQSNNNDGAYVRRRFYTRKQKKNQNRAQNQSNLNNSGNNSNSQNQPMSPTSSSTSSTSSSLSSSKRNEQNHKRDDNQQSANHNFNKEPPKIIDLTTSPSPYKKQTRSKLGIIPHPASQPIVAASHSPPQQPPLIANAVLPPASIVVSSPLVPSTTPLSGSTVMHPLAMPTIHPTVALPLPTPSLHPSPVPVQPLPQPTTKKAWVPRSSGSSEIGIVASNSAPVIAPVFTPPVAVVHPHPNTFPGKIVRRPSFVPPWGVPARLPITPIESMSKDDPEFYATLSDEITRFAIWLSLTPNERRLRTEVVQRISNTAKRLWPRCHLKTIGSIETNLCLPSSDIDLVVFGADGRNANPLEALGAMIRRSSIASNMQLITRARVPIIKLVDRDTGYRVDISFEVIDGVKNTDLIKQYLNSCPEVQPLVLVIKSLLNYYRLNETFSGGIGSYALTILVTYFVQSHPGLSLGEMLTAFFYEFGCTFDYERNGVSILQGPHLFSKWERGWAQEFQPNLLSIEDPANPENDVGRGSFEILRIKEAFKNAYEEITQPQPDILYHSSLLCRIIWMTPEVLDRR